MSYTYQNSLRGCNHLQLISGVGRMANVASYIYHCATVFSMQSCAEFAYQPMQTGIIEVFICRRLHTNTSTILICIWLVCKLCTTLHTKCCGAVYSIGGGAHNCVTEHVLNLALTMDCEWFPLLRDMDEQSPPPPPPPAFSSNNYQNIRDCSMSLSRGKYSLSIAGVR